MAYWKYHIKSGDLLEFTYENEDGVVRSRYGTLKAIVFPPGFDQDAVETTDDIPLSEMDVRIQSGTETVDVPLDDVTSRTKKEDRETDIPALSEGLRFSGGVGQKS